MSTVRLGVSWPYVHPSPLAVGILDHCTRLRVRPATRKEVARFHSETYIDSVKAKSDHDGGDAGECAPIGRGSYEVALYAGTRHLEGLSY